MDDYDSDIQQQSTTLSQHRPDPSAQPARPRNKIRKVTAACLACRRRKTKCSGSPPPCEACRQHRSDCTIDPDADRRRKVPKAILGDLDSHGPALTRLVDALRTPNRYSQALLRSIRSGSTLPQILAFIDEHKLGVAGRVSPPSLEPLSPKLNTDQSRDSNDLIDPDLLSSPLFHQHASLNSSRPSSRSMSTSPIFPGQSDSFVSTGQPMKTHSASLLQKLYEARTTNKSMPLDRQTWHPSLRILASAFDDESSEALARHPNGHWLLPDRSAWHATPGYVNVFGNLSMSSAVRANNYPEDMQKLQLANFSMPEHLILPLNLHDNSLLSNVTTSFRIAAMKMIQDGVPIAEVFGPENPNMDLILRERRPTDHHSISNWAAELCRNFPAFELPEQLRGAFVFTKYMRWVILPTAESYAALPSDYRPTDIQRLIPHAPLIDLQPTGALRDALCLDLRDFLTPQEDAISVNWPYSDEDCLEVDPITGYTQVTQQFHDHILDENNLTFSSVMLKAFPELRGRVNIRERQPRAQRRLSDGSW